MKKLLILLIFSTPLFAENNIAIEDMIFIQNVGGEHYFKADGNAARRHSCSMCKHSVTFGTNCLPPKKNVRNVREGVNKFVEFKDNFLEKILIVVDNKLRKSCTKLFRYSKSIDLKGFQIR